MKTKALYLFMSLVAITVLSCGSSKPVTQAQMDALDQLVQNRHFSIESDWAYPLTTGAVQQVLNSGLLPPGSSSGSINLIGNSNFLTVSGDSITSYLPYFGERQMNVDYGGTDNAIQLKGTMEHYQAEIDKDHNYRVTFKANSKSEQFDVYITLTPRLKSTIVINSATRHPIRYSGTVEAVKE